MPDGPDERALGWVAGNHCRARRAALEDGVSRFQPQLALHLLGGAAVTRAAVLYEDRAHPLLEELDALWGRLRGACCARRHRSEKKNSRSSTGSRQLPGGEVTEKARTPDVHGTDLGLGGGSRSDPASEFAGRVSWRQSPLRHIDFLLRSQYYKHRPLLDTRRFVRTWLANSSRLRWSRCVVPHRNHSTRALFPTVSVGPMRSGPPAAT